jgi:hypothetical protein
MDPKALSLAGASIAIGTLEMLYEKKIISLEDGRSALDKAMKRLGPLLQQLGPTGPEAVAIISSLQSGTFSARAASK